MYINNNHVLFKYLEVSVVDELCPTDQTLVY